MNVDKMYIFLKEIFGEDCVSINEQLNKTCVLYIKVYSEKHKCNMVYGSFQNNEKGWVFNYHDVNGCKFTFDILIDNEREHIEMLHQLILKKIEFDKIKSNLQKEYSELNKITKDKIRTYKLEKIGI